MATPQAHESDRRVLVDGRPARVLVVDDDELTTKQFSEMLRLEGFEALTAHDATDGLRKAVEGRPDAIVLDLRMPLVDGVGLLEQLRGTSEVHETPVVIITGDYLLDDSLVERMRTLGAEVRFKPFWLDDFITMVRTLLRLPPTR